MSQEKEKKTALLPYTSVYCDYQTMDEVNLLLSGVSVLWLKSEQQGDQSRIPDMILTNTNHTQKEVKKIRKTHKDLLLRSYVYTPFNSREDSLSPCPKVFLSGQFSFQMPFDQLIYAHKNDHITGALGDVQGVLPQRFWLWSRRVFLKQTSQLFPFTLRRHIYLLVIKRSQGTEPDSFWM